jgi:hypothetical protein
MREGIPACSVVLILYAFLPFITGAFTCLNRDRLNWTGCGGPQNFLSPGSVRLRVIEKCLLAMQSEHVRGEKAALRVALAAIEVHNETEPASFVIFCLLRR